MSEVIDSFTDADSTPIESHVPETGGPWVISEDIGSPSSGDPVIISNSLRVVNASSTSERLIYPSTGGDMTGVTEWVITVNLRYGFGQFDDNGSWRIRTRSTREFGPMNNDYLVSINVSANTLQARGESAITVTWVREQDYELRLEYNDPVMSVYLDDVLIETTDGPYNGDNSAAPTGVVGLGFDSFDPDPIVIVNSFSYTLGPPPPNPEFWTQFVKTAETV